MIGSIGAFSARPASICLTAAAGPTRATGRSFGSEVTPGQENASTMMPTTTESATPIPMTLRQGLWTDAGTVSMVTPRVWI